MKKASWIIAVSILLSLSCFGGSLFGRGNEEPHTLNSPSTQTAASPSDKQSPGTTPASGLTITPTERPNFTPTPTQTEPPPAPISLYNLHMSDAMTGWGIAGEGLKGDTIVRTEDGGATWKIVFTMPDPLKEENATHFTGSFPNRDTAWVTPTGADYVPVETVVFFSRDGGQSWQSSMPLPTYGLGELYDVFLESLDGDQAWLLTQLTVMGTGVNFTQRLFHTGDGGASWEEHTLILDEITGLDFINQSQGIITIDLTGAYAEGVVGPTAYTTSNGGQTWQEQNIPDALAQDFGIEEVWTCDTYHPFLWCTMTGNIIVSCKNQDAPPTSLDFFLRTDNGGVSWDFYDYPGGDLWMVDHETGWAVNSEIFVTWDGGRTWTTTSETEGENPRIFFLDDNIGWKIIERDNQRYLYNTIDGGVTWTLIEVEIQAGS